MLIDAGRLERLLREEKARAHQNRERAREEGSLRMATYEAGRHAGADVALKILQDEVERYATTMARSA